MIIIRVLLKKEYKYIIWFTIKKCRINFKIQNFGFDITFKIISNSYKPYKLMSIYSLEETNNDSIILAYILFKYKDSESFKKIYPLLKEIYNYKGIRYI